MATRYRQPPLFHNVFSCYLVSLLFYSLIPKLRKFLIFVSICTISNTTLSCLYSVLTNKSWLLQKVEEADNTSRILSASLNEANNSYRKLDREVNTLRPEIMQLQREKQHLTE